MESHVLVKLIWLEHTFHMSISFKHVLCILESFFADWNRSFEIGFEDSGLLFQAFRCGDRPMKPEKKIAEPSKTNGPLLQANGRRHCQEKFG